MRAWWLVLLMGCGGSPPRTADGSRPGPPQTRAGEATTSGTAGSTSVTPRRAARPRLSPRLRPRTTTTVVIGAMAATGHFDPKSTLDDLRPDLMACFRRVYVSNPAIHGSLPFASRSTRRA